jgi:beta-glucanase (GH16 family)
MVTSYPGFAFRYGFLQVVAKIAHSRGLWPALWLASRSSPGPEVDIVESWGINILVASYYHPWPAAAQDRGLIPVDWTTGWQTYTLSWTRTTLTYYVGTHVVLRVTKGVPHKAMYFVADLAEYERPFKGHCSGAMEIRSVKVWKN